MQGLVCVDIMGGGVVEHPCRECAPQPPALAWRSHLSEPHSADPIVPAHCYLGCGAVTVVLEARHVRAMDMLCRIGGASP